MANSLFLERDQYSHRELLSLWSPSNETLTRPCNTRTSVSDFAGKVVDAHTTPSDTDESSDVDSLWSGSAPSTRMSSPALSGIYPYELFMSSLQSQEKRDEKSTPSTPDQEPSSDIVASNFGKQTSVSRYESPTSEAANSSLFSRKSTNPNTHVDYLSHDWVETDLWASWKYLTTNSTNYSNRKRLENASWRAWEKCRSNLTTVSPASLNWLKECDTTWLYGPLLHSRPVVLEDSPPNGTRKTIQRLASTSAAFPIKKPILKRKDNLTELGETEVLLSRSQSVGSLLNNEAVSTSPNIEAAPKIEPYRLLIETPSITYARSFSPSLSCSGSSAAGSPRKEHVHFSHEVEQRIVLEITDEESSDRGNLSADDTESSSEDELIIMKRYKGRRQLTPPPKKKRWTRALPSTHLKWYNDDDKQSCGHKETRLMSPSPSGFLRRSESQNDTLLSDSDEDGYSLDLERQRDGGLHTRNRERIVGSRHNEEPSKLETINILSSPMPRNSSSLRNVKRTINTLEAASVLWLSGESERPANLDLLASAGRRAEQIPQLFEKLKTPILSIKFDQTSKPSVRQTTLGATWGSTDVRVDSENFPDLSRSRPSTSPGIDEEPLLFELLDIDSCFVESDLPGLILHKRKGDKRLAETQAVYPWADDIEQNRLEEQPRPFDQVSTDKLNHPSNDPTVKTENFSESLAVIDDTDGYETATESYSGDSLETASTESIYERLCDAAESRNNDTDLASALTPLQRALVERIMAEFWTIFHQTWSEGHRSFAGGASPTSNYTEPTVGSSNSKPQNSKKRRKREDETPDDRSGQGQGSTPGSSNTATDVGDMVRFACPYRKHDPQLYSVYTHSVCAVSNWPTISRVKEHLYRAHRTPAHCKRCWVQFKSQALLDAHLTVATTDICDLRPGVPPEGICPEQERRLRSRKKVSPNQNEEDRWRDIYKILFPDEEIPSPYFDPLPDNMPMSPDSRELAGYEEYIRRELPRLVRSNIEEAVRLEMQPLEASLISNLVSIVRDCQDMVFRSYRQSQGAHDESSRPPSAISDHSLPVLPPSLDPPLQRNVGESSRSGQQDLISTVWRAPPAQSPVLAAPTVQLDQTQATLSEFLSIDKQSDADSGYASEPFHPCGCYGSCTCGRSQEQQHPFYHGQQLGQETVDWAEWGMFPQEDQFDLASGGFEWKAD